MTVCHSYFFLHHFPCLHVSRVSFPFSLAGYERVSFFFLFYFVLLFLWVVNSKFIDPLLWISHQMFYHFLTVIMVFYFCQSSVMIHCGSLCFLLFLYNIIVYKFTFCFSSRVSFFLLVGIVVYGPWYFLLLFSVVVALWGVHKQALGFFALSCKVHLLSLLLWPF